MRDIFISIIGMYALPLIKLYIKICKFCTYSKDTTESLNMDMAEFEKTLKPIFTKIVLLQK